MKISLKNIRETQKKLRNLNDEQWCDLYARQAKTKRRSPSTIWYWENGTRQPDVRYLRFLCDEFNYNPAFILGLVDKPVFSLETSEKDFPDTDRILDALNKNNNIIIAFCKMLLKKIPVDVKKAHLTLYGKHPDIYTDIVTLVDTFEKHPDAF